jgi:hypothetical protein
MRRADHSSKESYRLSNDHETENQRPGPKGTVEPVNIYMEGWGAFHYRGGRWSAWLAREVSKIRISINDENSAKSYISVKMFFLEGNYLFILW